MVTLNNNITEVQIKHNNNNNNNQQQRMIESLHVRKQMHTHIYATKQNVNVKNLI